jgi:3-oxoacyl-[acyl-carrier protein] reductase
MTSHVVDKMIASRTKGVVVNISSISSKGNPGQSAYSAAKAGINALTATWSKEFGAFGIRVVAVSPGFINTESTHIALNESMILELSKEIPLGRLGNTSDIAKSVIYAFECDYLNGKILEIDGGLVM